MAASWVQGTLRFWLGVLMMVLALAWIALWVWSRIDPGHKVRGTRPPPASYPQAGSSPHSDEAPVWPVGAVAAPPVPPLLPSPPGTLLAPPRAAAPVVRPEAEVGVDGDRRQLVLLCIDVADRLRDSDPALRSRLHRGLAEVGIRVDEPVGGSFDRDRHDAVGAEAAASPEHDRRIARTERAGYHDGPDVVRRPEVVLFSWEGSPDDR